MNEPVSKYNYEYKNMSFTGMLGHYVGWFCLVVLATGADKSEKGCVNHPMSACPVVDITKGKVL